MLLLNSLTPVTFAALYQLVIGNLILGLLEAFLISKIFKLNSSYPIIIAANYISAIVGFWVSSALLDDTELNMIRSYENGSFPQAMFAYTGIAFFITLLIEFPFYYLGIKTVQNTRLPLKELLKVLVSIHLISYFVTIVTWLVMVN